MMRKAVQWAFWIILAVLVYKVGMWVYQGLGSGNQAQHHNEVFDHDKVCRINADTGQCICRHRQTNQKLSISYEECVSRAYDPDTQ